MCIRDSPEVVPPQFALGEKAAGWGEELRAAVNARETAKAGSV